MTLKLCAYFQPIKCLLKFQSYVVTLFETCGIVGTYGVGTVRHIYIVVEYRYLCGIGIVRRYLLQ